MIKNIIKKVTMVLSFTLVILKPSSLPFHLWAYSKKRNDPSLFGLLLALLGAWIIR